MLLLVEGVLDFSWTSAGLHASADTVSRQAVRVTCRLIIIIIIITSATAANTELRRTSRDARGTDSVSFEALMLSAARLEAREDAERSAVRSASAEPGCRLGLRAEGWCVKRSYVCNLKIKIKTWKSSGCNRGHIQQPFH